MNLRLLLLALSAATIPGCADAPRQPPTGQDSASRPGTLAISQLLKRPADYYTDDGPDGAPPVDLDRVADAVPRIDPLHSSANEPYTVFGRDYVPIAALVPYRRQGTASWYGRKFHGQRTAGGEIYDMYAMTGSHTTLPIPSYARITNLANRASVIVRINDRGPFASGRITDVSYAAAHRLGFVQSGSAQVEVEAVLPAGYAAARAPQQETAASVSEPQPAVPVTNERGSIFLQLGAFSVRANAESFRARIARQIESLDAEVSIERHGALYRVQLGPYRDRAGATAAAARLRTLMELKPVVVTR